MAISYNNIIKRLNDFADNHFFLQTFSHGSPEDLDLEKYTDYPLMHVVLTSADIARDDRTSPFVQTYSLDVYILDKPSDKDQKENRQKEIISDSIEICKDVLADISLGFSIFVKSELYGVDGGGITPLEEETKNVLSGALLSIDIDVPAAISACNAPLTGVTPSDGACPVATVRNGASGAGEYEVSVASGGTLTLPNISVMQQDDTVIESNLPSVVDVKVDNADVTAAAYNGTLIRINVDTITPSGWAYQQHPFSTTSTYETYDQGWWFINRNADMYHTNPDNPATIAALDSSSATPNLTLIENNVHGNKNRFTAQDGTQTIAVGDVIEDHLYYREYINEQYTASFSNHLANAEADTTDGGATNKWMLATPLEYYSIISIHDADWPAIFSDHTASNYWLNEAYVFNTSQKHYGWALQNISRRTPGTTAYFGLRSRKGTW